MIGQSKKHSLMDSLLNIAIGYGIAITAQVIVFPWFGIQIPLHDNLMIGGIFTVVSLIRSYVLRRCFNWWHCQQARKSFRQKHGDPYSTFAYMRAGIDLSNEIQDHEPD